MRPRALRTGLLVQSVGDQQVVYDQRREQLHVLNRTTALVWRLCDGRHTLEELVGLVGRELDAPADANVIMLALAQLDDARLLEARVAPTGGPASLSRREMLQRAAAVAVGVLVPSITSCGSPLAPDRALGPTGSSRLEDVSTTTTTILPTTTTTARPTTTTTILPTTTTTISPTTTTTISPTTTTTSSPTTTTTLSPTTTTTSTTTTPLPQQRKVKMCHKGKTIMVDQNAVQTHLNSGDTLGPCPK